MGNENQTGKIKNFYYHTIGYHSGKNYFSRIVLPIAILITLILSCWFVDLSGGIEVFKYPQTTYDYLETEIKKVIVNDTYIDMEQISDNSISSSITYLKDEGTDNWNLCKVKLSKSEDVFVEGMITKNENGTLDMEVSHEGKRAYYVETIGSYGALFMLITATIYFICYGFFFVIIGILIFIEWIISKKIKKTS